MTVSFLPCTSLYKTRASCYGITASNTFTQHTTASSSVTSAMIKLILFVSLVATAASQPQQGLSSSYRAPNGQQNGSGNGNGLSNGYSAPLNGIANGANGGNGNGFTGRINGGANGGNGGNGNGYSAPANGRTNGANGINGIGNGYTSPSNGVNGGNGANGRFNGGSNGLSSAYGAPGGAEAELAELAASLPGGGVPGEDFPVLSEVPDTGFQCGDQAVSGYYADDDGEARCQVFHICQLRESGLVQQDSFLCPNGTVFNQQYLVCDWWFNFECSQAKDFYSVNELIGVIENGAYGVSGNGQNGNGVNGNGYSQSGNGNGGRQNGNGNGAASLSNGYAAPANGNGRNGGYA
ncbi:Chitin binding domain [Trinorchestia longiramus]|nr:Chitin binding domain [Trinorchestia longiramus]